MPENIREHGKDRLISVPHESCDDPAYCAAQGVGTRRRCQVAGRKANDFYRLRCLKIKEQDPDRNNPEAACAQYNDKARQHGPDPVKASVDALGARLVHGGHKV
jgi:hypothetical protein